MRKFLKVASVNSEKCKEAPCKKSCPASVDVPTYIGLISKKNFEAAYKVILSDIPFPSVCGRVCHHPCETSCRRIGRDEALAIRALKRVPCDYLMSENKLPTICMEMLNGKKVAVVGGGPAGLSAAYYLTQKGYRVTVFEANDSVGGMMRFGIPDYRLPKDVLNREIATITDCGVNIETGVIVGQNKSIEEIFLEGYESLFIAIGANCANRLNIPGEELKGVVSGIEFLFNLNNGNKEDFTGKKVAVIGAGNVAADAARSAVRLGARSVDIYYRRSKRDMPISDEELEDVEREGIKIQTMLMPMQIIGRNGVAEEIELIRMQPGSLDSSGRNTPVEINGSNYTVAADIIITAVGYHPAAQNVNEQLDTTKWGSVAVNKENMTTSIPMVFAGGDCVSGATSIVEAIAEGKRAASIIDKALGGNGILVAVEVDLGFEDSFSTDANCENRAKEYIVNDIDSFCETNLGYSLDIAIKEAARCLHCDLVCNTCERVCPVMAVSSKVLGKAKSAYVNAELCTGCGICEQRCPDQAIGLLNREVDKVIETTVPTTLRVDIEKLCSKAHMKPEQVICYCHRVKAEEVAAAILSGASTPEEVAKMTGARTGCGVLCANSVMRQFEAAGICLDKAPGYQWYGGVPTIWKIPEEVLKKYDKEYRLLSDREHMNKLFPNKN